MATPATATAVNAADTASVAPRKRHRGLTKFMRNRAAVFGAVLVLLARPRRGR